MMKALRSEPMRGLVGWIVMPVIVSLVASWSAPAAPPSRLAQETERRIDAALDTLESRGDFVATEIELSDLFDSLIAHTEDREAAAFESTAFALRLVRQLGLAEQTPQLELLSFLRANEAFARALVFAVKPDEEDMDEVFTLVDRMRRERAEQVNSKSGLAAAICVVHDRPLKMAVNENVAVAPDPVELFDYFVRNEARLSFGLVDVPVELLVHVVDVAAPIAELEWACGRYAGDRAIGERFFDIQYDHDHFQSGTPKKSTMAGWGLMNILQYGGVCADQAYFATTVGKAIGVPTAYTIGVNADVGHAWVGFLQADAHAAWWNFESGRHEAYAGLRGNILDPQTRRMANDSEVSLLADYARAQESARIAAAAFTDAALRLASIEKAGGEFAPPAIIETPRSRRGRPLRTPSVEASLDLLEAGLKLAPGYARGWYAVRDLAADGRLTLAQKTRWAEVLDRLCARKYPDFTLDILAAMIESVEDVKDQNRFWNTAFARFQTRHDLAAAIRLAQAEMWAKAGDIDAAGQCYLDVIGRYANAGPFVITALRRAEDLLREAGRVSEVVALYEDTWARIRRPEDMAGQFAMQSNWYRVGMGYAAKLEEAGRDADSQQVRALIRGR